MMYCGVQGVREKQLLLLSSVDLFGAKDVRGFHPAMPCLEGVLLL
jgi:hypothetical protein